MNNGGMDCMTSKDMEKNMKSMMGNKDHNFFGHMEVNDIMAKKMKKKKMMMPKMDDMSQYDDLGYVTRRKK